MPNQNGSRRQPKADRCKRESCTRQAREPHRYCSYLCKLIAEEMNKAHRVCTAIGPGTYSTELWTAAVELNEVWTQIQQLHAHLKAAALSTGLTTQQWAAVVTGEIRAEQQEASGQADTSAGK